MVDRIDRSYFYLFLVIFGGWFIINTVDGRHPAPGDRWFIGLFLGFQPSKYWCRISSIRSSTIHRAAAPAADPENRTVACVLKELYDDNVLQWGGNARVAIVIVSKANTSNPMAACVAERNGMQSNNKRLVLAFLSASPLSMQT